MAAGPAILRQQPTPHPATTDQAEEPEWQRNQQVGTGDLGPGEVGNDGDEPEEVERRPHDSGVLVGAGAENLAVPGTIHPQTRKPGEAQYCRKDPIADGAQTLELNPGVGTQSQRLARQYNANNDHRIGDHQ